ncbi:hypothetical protein HDZ31DRAFT_40479 [Schizophyllum fasciatum]
MISLVESAIWESDPKKQAKLLALLSHPKTWRQAFRAMDSKQIPIVQPGARYPVTMRVRDAAEAVQAFSATLLQYEDTKDPAVLRVLFFGFHLLWDAAWAWLEFLDCLSGKVKQMGRDAFFMSLATPAALATALALALQEKDPDTIAMMQEGPLERFLAQWYHDYGMDPASDPEQATAIQQFDEPVFTRTKLIQDLLGDFLDVQCPYHDRVVQLLHQICGGRPERLRRRFLTNLQRDVHSSYLVKDKKMLQTYIDPLFRVLAIPSYNFKPPSGRTVRRQMDILLDLSRSAKTAVRAVFMCTIIEKLHVLQPGERIIVLALQRGLLRGLHNIASHMPRLAPEWAQECQTPLATILVKICMSLRVRQVTRSVLRVKDDLRLPPWVSTTSTMGLLPIRWQFLLDTIDAHTAAWKSYRKRAENQVRRCSNSECTSGQSIIVKLCICKEAYYCSKDCQQRDWLLRHRISCAGERAKCDLVLEDRVFLEELTKLHIVSQQQEINWSLDMPNIQDMLHKGCILEVNVRYEARSANVDVTVDTVEGWPKLRDEGDFFFPVVHIEYEGIHYTWRMERQPLHTIRYEEPKGGKKKRAPFDWIR